MISSELQPVVVNQGENQGEFAVQKLNDKNQRLLSARCAFRRAVETALKLTRGVSKGAKIMNAYYWGEVIHKTHGYGVDLNRFKAIWENSGTQDNFNEWFSKLEFGEEAVRHVEYLDEAKLQKYKMEVDQRGRISSKMIGYEVSSHLGFCSISCSSCIFVVSPDREIYIGKYNQGYFHHSSFLSGGPVLFAGELALDKGKIVTITNKSGHYRTDKTDFLKGLYFLIQSGADLSSAQLMFSIGNLYMHSGQALEYYYDNLINNQKQALIFLTQKEYDDAVTQWEQLKQTLKPVSSPSLKDDLVQNELMDQKVIANRIPEVVKETSSIWDTDSEDDSGDDAN